MSVCVGRTCLPFAKVWIPWHYKPRTDLIALGKHSWPVNSTSKNTPTCKARFPPVSHHRRWARNRKQVLMPYAAAWQPQSFPYQGPALPSAIYLSLDGIRDIISSGIKYLFFRHILKFFSGKSYVSHLFVQSSAKYLGWLDRLVIKPNQRSPSFPSGYVQSAYRV